MSGHRSGNTRIDFRDRNRYLIVVILLGLGIVGSINIARAADFTFAWGASGMTAVSVPQGNAAWPLIISYPSGNSNTTIHLGGAGSVNDSTPFVNEPVQDIYGNQYFHMLLYAASPSNSLFKQETYIRIGSVDPGIWNDGGVSGVPRAPSDSGGEVGWFHNGSFNRDCGTIGNACDPIGANNLLTQPTDPSRGTGNGTGNPAHMLMNQVLVENAADANITTGYAPTGVCSGSFCQQFKKVNYSITGTNDINANKPLIKQQVNDNTLGSVRLNFLADMSAISYSNNSSPLTLTNNMATAGGFVNTLTMTGVPGLADGVADFDISKTNASNEFGGRQTGESTTTAGQYTFTPGAGNGGIGWANDGTNTTMVYTPGTYTYIDPLSNSFDPKAINYSLFCNSAQNTPDPLSHGC